MSNITYEYNIAKLCKQIKIEKYAPYATENAHNATFK